MKDPVRRLTPMHALLLAAAAPLSPTSGAKAKSFEAQRAEQEEELQRLARDLAGAFGRSLEDMLGVLREAVQVEIAARPSWREALTHAHHKLQRLARRRGWKGRR